MFTTITRWFTQLLADAGPLGTTVLLVGAFVFGITTAFKAMKAFGNQQIGQGLVFVILTIVIAIIAVATLGGIMGVGQKAGKDLNKSGKFGMVSALAIVPTYASYYKYKAQSKLACMK